MPAIEKSLSDWLDGLFPAQGLTKSQRSVVQTLVGNQQLASFADISEIAERAMVNGSTVVRTAQALGFRGWPDLQQELRGRYLASLSSVDTLTVHTSTSGGYVHEAIRRDIDNLNKAHSMVDPAVVSSVVQALTRAKSILTLGMGSVASPAALFAHLGATMGYPAHYESRGGVHIATALAGLSEGDVLLIFNVWRQHTVVINAARVAKRLGVIVVVVTDVRMARLPSLADYVIIVPSEGLSFFQSVTALMSVTSGLLAGMQEAEPERTRDAIRRIQNSWHDLGNFD